MAKKSTRSVEAGTPHAPIHAVWELTMRCDHACAHCGSRAADPRETELDTPKLLEIADRLGEMGCREVTLIGGEAYLHPGFYTIISRLRERGIRPTLQTGGRGVTPRMAQKLADAGMAAIGVSVDGPEDTHDELRASPGSFQATMRALRNARDAGIITSVNTQVNRLTWNRLRETLELLEPLGIAAWRAQLTAPMGRAADRPEWILEPWRILDVLETLYQLKLEQAEKTRAKGKSIKKMLDVQLGNNVGYFGPYETVLRSRPGRNATHYQGCQAGRYVLGIESGGDIKACPSLPSAPYIGGNLLELPLEELWNTPELAFARESRTDELWGFCKTCMYAEVCQAGCSFTAHTTLGRRGNNPFCYHRADTLRQQGLRERLVHKEAASGEPYDFGRFEIVTEPWVEA